MGTRYNKGSVAACANFRSDINRNEICETNFCRVLILLDEKWVGRVPWWTTYFPILANQINAGAAILLMPTYNSALLLNRQSDSWTIVSLYLHINVVDRQIGTHRCMEERNHRRADRESWTYDMLYAISDISYIGQYCGTKSIFVGYTSVYTIYLSWVSVSTVYKASRISMLTFVLEFSILWDSFLVLHQMV